MTDAEQVQQWLLQTVRLMVDRPDDVKVELIRDGERLMFRLHVHSSEVGKMIGKQGRTGRALRTIGGTITAARGKWFNLDIADDSRFPQ
jgi:uncharacterized protein